MSRLNGDQAVKRQGTDWNRAFIVAAGLILVLAVAASAAMLFLATSIKAEGTQRPTSVIAQPATSSTTDSTASTDTTATTGTTAKTDTATTSSSTTPATAPPSTDYTTTTRPTESPTTTSLTVAPPSSTTLTYTTTTLSPYSGKGYRVALLDITIPSPHCEQALQSSLRNRQGIISMSVRRGQKNDTIIYDPKVLKLPDLLEYTAAVGGSTLVSDEGL